MNINDMLSADHAKYNVNGTQVDIQRLRELVVEAVRIVDELDWDEGPEAAQSLYENLAGNDELMWFQGELREKKFRNESTGRITQYWSAFRKFLDETYRPTE